jgi:hypothetical protein
VRFTIDTALIRTGNFFIHGKSFNRPTAAFAISISRRILFKPAVSLNNDASGVRELEDREWPEGWQLSLKNI